MSEHVIIFIQAYNAAETLNRAIESILNQTNNNFTLYVLDNGSLDDTRTVIMNYAGRDNRIIPMIRDKNHLLDTDKTLPLITFIDQIKFQYPSSCYFVNLDADDEYSVDFLEKMIDFVTENNLDIATCGTDWIDEKSGKIIKHKLLEKNIILDGQDFAEQFPIYRNFMVTVWGGVYSLELLQKCDLVWLRNAKYFTDTAFCMEAFRRSKRAGVLAESLHRYYISPKTVSNQFNTDWFQECKYLHNISVEFLLDYGEISKQNQDYLDVLFLILIKYILPRIQGASIDLSEKLKSLNEIFSDDMTRHILRYWDEVGIYSNKDEFLYEIKEWITMQDGWEKEYSTVENIISSMNV
ncbi:glycosyltransferase [Desulfosporosinus sp. SYSU MS00001]|uniref:glycosyltransferase n=1 Tax=Desulfosporosinus sp. SYSU MS00001 TaxID=3416284 RepID=UPI003CF5CDD5